MMMRDAWYMGREWQICILVRESGKFLDEKIDLLCGG